MKTHSLLPAVFLAAALLCPSLPGQEPAPVAPVDAADAPSIQGLNQSERTCIPHPLEVTPFTPPPPPVVKRLPAIRIDASVTHRNADGTTLTLQRGEPSTEPDLPPPPPPRPTVAPHEPTQEEIAKRIWNHRHNFNLGATIYDHKISVINWTDQETLVQYEAVCGFDIGLLAGVGKFIHRGETYGFMLIYSHFNSAAMRRFASQWRLKIPQVADGEILILKGDVTNIAATAPMTVIKDIITAEKARLIPYQAARDTYFKASTAWHAAHPPIPRNETIILRPHRGSRYLPSTKSEMKN